jgi:predicted phosphodiesterase
VTSLLDDRPLTEGELSDLQVMTRREFEGRHKIGFRTWKRLRDLHCRYPHVPRVAAPLLPQEVVLVDEDVLVAADWHSPHYDHAMVDALIRVAVQEKITHLVLAGDFIDEAVFFMGGNEKPPGQATFREELHSTGRLLAVLLQVFEKITWLRGNHEERLLRLSKAELGMEELRKMVAEGQGDRIRVTDRDYVYATWSHDPDATWRLPHGVGGSASIATNAAVKKAEIYGCHVAQGHDHLIGIRQTQNGRHLGVDIGCMLQPEWIGYKAMNTKTYPMWNQGFLMLRKGRPTLFTRKWTDWSRYGVEL